jgi:ribosomal-protein-alanine acetyltransferase
MVPKLEEAMVAVHATRDTSKKSIVIRAPRREEMDRLLMIERRCFRSHRFTNEEFEYHFANPSSIFAVVAYGERIVGYIAGVASHNSRDRIAKVYSMAVLPQWRRLGIASKLLDYFEREAIKRGCRRAKLEVRRTNRSARSLYDRTGYQVDKVLKDYYAPGSDGLRMLKQLS